MGTKSKSSVKKRRKCDQKSSPPHTTQECPAASAMQVDEEMGPSAVEAAPSDMSYKERAELAEAHLRDSKLHDRGIREAAKELRRELDIQRSLWKSSLAIGDVLGGLLIQHAGTSAPERVRMLRDANQVVGSESRDLESQIWTKVLQRLRESPSASLLYSLCGNTMEHRKDLLEANHPREHWLAMELRRQVVLMVVEVCTECRFAAPWYLSSDGQHSLWWWRHPSRGLLPSETKGLESALKFVRSNIVRRYMYHPSHSSSDSRGDEYFRDHASAFDKVMSRLCIEDIADEVRDAVAVNYAQQMHSTTE